MQSLMTVNYTQRTTPSLGCTDHYFQSTVTALCVCFNITTKTDPSKCMFKFMIYAILLDPYVFSRRHDCAIWVLIHPLALKTVLYESQTYGLALFRNYLFAANFYKMQTSYKINRWLPLLSSLPKATRNNQFTNWTSLSSKMIFLCIT